MIETGYCASCAMSEKCRSGKFKPWQITYTGETYCKDYRKASDTRERVLEFAELYLVWLICWPIVAVLWPIIAAVLCYEEVEG